MIRGKKHNNKRHERDDCNGKCKQRCAAKLAKTRIDCETEECDEWQDQPAGESFEGNGCERGFWFAIGLGKARDAQYVAANGGGKNVRNKLTGEIERYQQTKSFPKSERSKY